MWDVDGILTSDISEHDKKMAAKERAERVAFYDIKAAAEHGGLNPFLRKSISNAREYDKWLFWHASSLDEQMKFHHLSELESILEKYAEEEIYTNGSFNIFMHTDDKIEELIERAKAKEDNVPELSNEAKVLRRKQYNCGNYKPREIKPTDYNCV